MLLAKLGKGMLFSVEQAFVGRDEKRAPLKTPAWEATYEAKELIQLAWLGGTQASKGEVEGGEICFPFSPFPFYRSPRRLWAPHGY